MATAPHTTLFRFPLARTHTHTATPARKRDRRTAARDMLTALGLLLLFTYPHYTAVPLKRTLRYGTRADVFSHRYAHKHTRTPPNSPALLTAQFTLSLSWQRSITGPRFEQFY